MDSNSEKYTKQNWLKNCKLDLLEGMKNAVDQKIQKISSHLGKMCISERYNKIIEAVYEVSTTFLKPPSRKSQYWFDFEDGQIVELSDTRRRACKEYLQTKLQE